MCLQRDKGMVFTESIGVKLDTEETVEEKYLTYLSF